MQIRSRTKPPRGGLWKYTHKISGVKFSSHQLGAIKYSIWKHEESNGYPQTPEQEIEDQLCLDHPASCVDRSHNEPPTRALQMGDIVRGTKVIAAFKLKGSPLVEHAEAERRASICASCKKNVDYSKPCSGLCQELTDLVQSMVGGATTKFDHQLKACQICGCLNTAQIHVPADILAKGVNEPMMRDFREVEHCWKWKAIDEYAGNPS